MKGSENTDVEKIKVFSSDDEKLKILGELLSNKSSRDIIRLLIDKEMYVNEIAKKLELRPNLVIHHLQKMESIDLVEIKNKKITRKGEEHRFFKIRSGMLIFPNKIESETDSGFLKKIFREGIKFSMIGIAAIVTYLIINKTHTSQVDSPIIPQVEQTNPMLYALIVIIIGLTLLYIKKRKKD